MKKIETLEDLLAWDDFKEFTKATLKLVGEEDICYVSKDKLEFKIDAGTWKGHAFLAGKKGDLAMKKLKSKGVIFREATCSAKGKQLTMGEIKPPKLFKEAEKLFLKLKLGYKVSKQDGAGDGGGKKEMPPEERKKKIDELRKMETNIDRIMGAMDV